ncbi:MAG: oxygen-independent coproporphyrinogen III oxidase [Synechococcales cyanobacterium C42_A2020_086]|jgi:oxygen-independent coproporphyrinogen-3 oxidase|nr:oxygen-independent coproporphyrinogen III oxidase [Synechococcales cyanobacterium C42_A2020_086]
MTFVLSPVQFDARLLQKYDRPLPRYTSYPTAAEFTSEFDQHSFKQAVAISNSRQLPLSLYVHIPFCQTACYFCGCNMLVTQSQTAVQSYVDCLVQEIRQTAALIDTSRPVTQMHWGGGTPNYLNLDQVELLWRTLQQHFYFAPNAEISVEINPRYINRDYIVALREIGFNRISFGIQDFNPKVQAAVNRVQPEDLLFDVMSWIRTAEFDSINVDLIYGLPHQTLRSFTETIEKTIALNPDRIAVFSFAYVPWLKPIQKHIAADALPNPFEKLDILQMAIETLTQHQYQYIGMDHFAKPDDELAIAQQQGTLKRNFQGYTTLPDAELFGFGLTSISMLHDAYAQNHKQLQTYFRLIETGGLPTERGIQLHRDDQIRRYIIMELMCQFGLSKLDVEARYHLDFDRYFTSELQALTHLENDGLVEVMGDRLQVTPVGRLLIRNIASVFDAYLHQKPVSRFSKAI